MSEEQQKQTVKEIIVAAFKEEGLEILEENAIKITKVVLKTLPKVFIATDNKVDDYAIPLLALVEKPILTALDKIDGHVG